MKFGHLLAFWLPPIIIFAHPLRDHKHETTVEKREATTAPGAPSSPNPLPNETDGVLVDGSIVNSNANVDTLNNSCWTEPNKRQHEMSDPEYDPFTCQICVIQSGVGPNAWYEAWVRDADNAAVGNLPPINLGPGTRVGKMWTFSAAADSLTMGITSNESPSSASAVTMMWGYQETPQMYFDAATRMGGTNCTFQNDGQDGTMTYFQCHFRCGIPRLIGNA